MLFACILAALGHRTQLPVFRPSEPFRMVLDTWGLSNDFGALEGEDEATVPC